MILLLGSSVSTNSIAWLLLLDSSQKDSLTWIYLPVPLLDSLKFHALILFATWFQIIQKILTSWLLQTNFSFHNLIVWFNYCSRGVWLYSSATPNLTLVWWLRFFSNAIPCLCFKWIFHYYILVVKQHSLTWLQLFIFLPIPLLDSTAAKQFYFVWVFWNTKKSEFDFFWPRLLLDLTLKQRLSHLTLLIPRHSITWFYC